MNDMMREIDDRANLAGTNRLEVLMFTLSNHGGKDSQLFGINVFKVKELLTVPPILAIPTSNDCLKGMANIRGMSVPVIDLMSYCGIKSDVSPNILVLTEYNDTTQGFLVQDVSNIVQFAWSSVLEPPPILAGIDASVITGISEIEDNKMLLILDVEKILTDVLGPIEKRKGSTIDLASNGTLKGKTIFFADDSKVARKQIEAILTRMGADYIFSTDGVSAWEQLQSLADEAQEKGIPVTDLFQLVISDVEMPRMDGYMLTKNIKSDVRFAGIPVVMHTSLSSDSNKRLGVKVGVDTYVAKLSPKALSDTLEGYLL